MALVLLLGGGSITAGAFTLSGFLAVLIVLVINGLIVFAAISLGGKLIKEMIMALMLQLF